MSLRENASELITKGRERLAERVRKRVLWVFVGLVATAAGVIALTTVPAWPVVGVAVATMLVAVNGLTSRLKQDSCLSCGQSLAGLPHCEHGAICPGCGTVSQARPMRVATTSEEFETPGDADDLDKNDSARA